jgi:hypothetical protein
MAKLPTPIAAETPSSLRGWRRDRPAAAPQIKTTGLPIKSQPANSPGLFPGLCVPFRDFCCRFVPISASARELATC